MSSIDDEKPDDEFQQLWEELEKIFDRESEGAKLQAKISKCDHLLDALREALKVIPPEKWRDLTITRHVDPIRFDPEDGLVLDLDLLDDDVLVIGFHGPFNMKDKEHMSKSLDALLTYLIKHLKIPRDRMRLSIPLRRKGFGKIALMKALMKEIPFRIFQLEKDDNYAMHLIDNDLCDGFGLEISLIHSLQEILQESDIIIIWHDERKHQHDPVVEYILAEAEMNEIPVINLHKYAKPKRVVKKK